MTVVYQADFHYTRDKGVLTLIQTLPDGTQDTSLVNLDEIYQLEKQTRNFNWNESPYLSREIGEKLFALLNGDNQTLLRALKEADDYGEYLQVMIKAEGPVSSLPFELLYYNNFLVPSRIHLIRLVSDWGKTRSLKTEDRPLKILFMACSPQGIHPVLEFEKEEEAIFDITGDLPVEIDIEDTGSLEGLGERLKTNEYDVVHITGHADIDKEGNPFFWMESEEGFPVHVTPSHLYEILSLNMPRLVFLSGCRTGETPEHIAAMSFAHQLVAEHVSTVLGWGLPVADDSARFAAEKLYFELSRGESILDAVRRTRYELFRHHPTQWSLLRLFADRTPLEVPIVQKGQKKRPKTRELQYTYLENSQVKVLKQGFIGRRGQIQQGIRCLRSNQDKVGLLLRGTGGLGKSCLAGKFCDRFKDHGLIIVHGELNAVSFHEALKDGFLRRNAEEGLNTLKIEEEMPDRIRRLCSSAFLNRQYLILLDDFEKNLEGLEEGQPELSDGAKPILKALLQYLPNSGKMTQLIISSRYSFPLKINGTNLVDQRLESIGLTSFRDADERKKLEELKHISAYPYPEIRQQIIDAGRGNPRLLEALDTLVGEAEGLDYVSLLAEIKNKQEEFVQELVLRQIFETQPVEFQTLMRRSAVYRLPVLKEGIRSVCSDVPEWELHVKNAVRLSLMEEDSTRKDALYWVTPLLREDLFGELQKDVCMKCHQSAVSYYQALLSASHFYAPLLAIELIAHALNAGLDDIALEESGYRLLPYLRETLAYKEALIQGEHILSQISKPKRNEKLSKFLFELGWIRDDMGNARKAIEYYEQALAIDREVFGDKHIGVGEILNGIGSAWENLGEHKKAIEYFEQALSVTREVHGNRHPYVASSLNNIGSAWLCLAEPKKAIEYFEQALSIFKAVYGDQHPHVATTLNNIGSAWEDLGEHKKAITYYEQALSVAKAVYGDHHPDVASSLNNIGLAWHYFAEHKKAITYYEQALSIVREVYGETHPYVATTLNNIGLAWHALEEHGKAITYYEQALSIYKAVYGDRHPHVAATLNNIGLAWKLLGEHKKAIEFYKQALSIYKAVYGDRHPHVAATLNNIGLAWETLEEPQKAIVYLEQALSILKAVYGDQHPYVATTLNNIGLAWDDLGKPQKAIGYFEQALPINKAIYGDHHPHVAMTLNNIGGAWYALGDLQRAKGYFQQAYSISREFYGDEHSFTKAVKEWLDHI
jgi:tetratricopeptide (TPR) repeat protein